MGSETAGINSGTKTPPRLCYHALRPSQRPESLGVTTPPLQAPGSVPFQWEVAPGRPRISDNPHRAKPAAVRRLEPPPRMSVLSSSSPAWQVSKVADAEVPTKAVLEGPYYVLVRPSASLFDGPSVVSRHDSLSSSFAFGERSSRHYIEDDSGRKERSAAWFWKRALRRRVAQSLVKKTGEPAARLSRSRSTTASKCYVDDGEGITKGGRRDGGFGGEAAAAAAAAAAANVRITRIRRSGSVPNMSTASTHLWAAIYGGLKQVAIAPWRSNWKSAGKRR